MMNLSFLTASKNTLSITLLATILFFSCCSTNNTNHKPGKAKKTPATTPKAFSVAAPANYKTVKFEDSFEVELRAEKGLVADSVIARINNKKIVLNSSSAANKYTCGPINETAGRFNVNLEVFYSDSLREHHSFNVTHVPGTEPQNISFKIIRSFPHDAMAYTQGLIYHKGKLYESTGKENRSSIREIDLNTGEVLRKKDLEPQFFGEGIGIVNNEIFMLTYRAQIGFVFDINTFEIKRKFNLQTHEGWGMTTYNDTLLMTDGSASLFYFLPDDYFTLIKQEEICNHKGLVNYLNELEYTPYGMFSNVYGSDIVYLIDIHRGIVTHVLDLKELFPNNVPHDMDHVLNGIAYNKETGTFYVTGKQWPIMYEIALSLN